MYSAYHTAITEEMSKFGLNEKVIFFGQQIQEPDNFYNTLVGIDKKKIREMPIAEEMQMGLSIGMSLEGYLPISIYQRMDFLPRLMDQIINHLNLISDLSNDRFNPKIIIRTTIGTTKPMDCGLQHCKDLTSLMLEACDFPVAVLDTADAVHYWYEFARNSEKSVLLIEKQENYYA